jgi:hypothetical protein
MTPVESDRRFLVGIYFVLQSYYQEVRHARACGRDIRGNRSRQFPVVV